MSGDGKDELSLICAIVRSPKTWLPEADSVGGIEEVAHDAR